MARSTCLPFLLVAFTACGGTEAGAQGGPAGGTGGSIEGRTSTGTSPPSAAEITCEGSKTLALPVDPATPGPFPVGAKTVTIAGLVTEIWYPAKPGSESGKTTIRYDLREHLPEADQGKIPDADNPYQSCDCYRDLPIDTRGPYPLLLFIHGTAAFRTQSLTFATHWASRGIVVVAADHPGIGLKDLLAGTFGGTQASDAEKVLDELKDPKDAVAFLKGKIAYEKMAMAGHSAGGGAIRAFGERPGVKVLIPMAAGGVDEGASLVSTLILGAQSDNVVSYDSQVKGFESSSKKKRLVGLKDAGHLAFSDLCAIGRDKGGLLQIAMDHGIKVNSLIANLSQDGCKQGQLSPERGWAIINAATSAVLEETLLCSKTATQKLSDLPSVYPEIGDYREEL